MNYEAPEGALQEAPIQPAKRKRLKRDITREIEAWATHIKSRRKNLLDVQLNQKNEPSIAPTWLVKQVNATYNVIKLRSEILDSVTQRMIDEKIIILGHNSIANEWRRKLLCWYEGLSDSEKQAIPVFGQTISVSKCLGKVPGMGNLKWARLNIPLVEDTFNEILEDLKKRGVIKSDYKTVAERNIEIEQKREENPRGDTWQTQMNALRAIPLSHINDLVPADPTRPFIQIFHMFAAASMGTKSLSGQLNFVEGFRQVSQHLKGVGFTGTERALACITPNYLTRLRNHLKEQILVGAMSTHTAQNALSCTRKLMNRALKIKGISFTSFVDTQGFETTRSTDEYRPYTSRERLIIKDACESEIWETNAIAADYVKFNGGCDPINEKGHLQKGFGTLENARWIFENKLDCRRVSTAFADKDNPYEKGFSRILNYSSMSIADIYASWGMIYELTSRLLAPYVTRLAQVTGLNADSLKTLDIDDFIKSHDITKRPYLRYWKERSGGEKLYHLDLFHADLMWLSVAQSVEVEKIFNGVRLLTRYIRERATPAVKEKLFIYESLKMSEYREVKSLEGSNIINLMMNRFAKDHNLKKDDDSDLSISASRLRPSLVAELVEQDVSLREIQMILGHKHVSTTISYLDKLEFSKKARKVVDEALKKIHKEYVLAQASGDYIKAPANSNVDTTNNPSSPAVIIRTGLVECRNVYDPPPEIRNSLGYKEGNPCALLNKCLSCRNSIISVSNLPDLFAMRRDYRSMMETTGVGRTPYGRVIRENLETLDSILTPSAQGFDAEQLEHAERLSEHILTSTLVEGMTL
ncbi:tyrosine-type recombinase/integrase [Pseudomonas sp. HY13-MNA-CIBAN-0226]|uniref:tyrosine-type recombinase/integrase n=1 Tax=Pseudomonas sp. HY13-MNA-CIBAN-0226 TaxID=3140473 RepID=UPI0033296644